MTERIQTELAGSTVSFNVSGAWLAYWLVILRVVVGWWLLHAGLGKILAWPFSASGYLGGAAAGTALGPVVAPFTSGALLAFTNVAIPVGQTLIGLGVIFGALTRLASYFGAFMMTFFYVVNGATGGWANGLVTGELLGLLLFAMIATLGAGRVLGIDAYLARTRYVESHPKLRYVMG